MVISRSAVIHAERLPIEPRPTAHTMGYRQERSRLYVGPYNSYRTIRTGSGIDYHMTGVVPGLGHV